MKNVFKREDLLDISFILLISLLSLTWFKGGNLIHGGDFGFPLARKMFFNLTLFAWDHFVSMGCVAPGQLASIFPYSLAGYVTELLRLSPVTFEKILFYFWFSSTGLGMYALCRQLSLTRVGAMFGALFYMMNPYAATVSWHVIMGPFIAGYSFTPWLLLLFVRVLDTEKLTDWALLFFVWLFFGTYSYINQSILVIHFLMLVFLFSMHIHDRVKAGQDIRRPLTMAVFSLLSWFILASYWLAPFILNMVDQSKSASSSALGFISNAETLKLNSASMLDSLRLHGIWALHQDWADGVPYYSWGKTYNSPLFVLLSFLPLFFCVIPFLLPNNKDRKYLCYFGLLFAFSLFFGKGVRPPFSVINFAVHDYLPLFGTAFRSTFQKWGILISFSESVLFGFGVNSLYNLVSKRFSLYQSRVAAAFAAFGVLLFCVYSFPFWDGQVIFSGGGIIRSARTTIPDSYYALRSWTSGQPGEFRIFSLPLSKNYNTSYAWGRNGYAGADFIRNYSTKPVINSNYGAYYDIPLLLGGEIEALSKKKLLRLFSLLHVKYLLVHHDINWQAISGSKWWVNSNRAAISEYLKNNPEFVLDRDFGDFKLYKLPEAYFIPLVYTAARPVIVEGKISDLAELSDNKYLTPDPLLILLAGDLPARQFPSSNYSELIKSGVAWKSITKGRSGAIPSISFRKVNSTRYEVVVASATNPFWLVFGDTFHPKWKLFRGDYRQQAGTDLCSVKYTRFEVCEGQGTGSFTFGDVKYLFKNSLKTDHFVANAYSNAWYIDPLKLGLGTDFVLEISFLSQALVYGGYLLIIVIVIFVAVLLLVKRTKKFTSDFLGLR